MGKYIPGDNFFSTVIGDINGTNDVLNLNEVLSLVQSDHLSNIKECISNLNIVKLSKMEKDNWAKSGWK